MARLPLLASLVAAFAFLAVSPTQAQSTRVVGEVVTSTNFTGPNDTIGVVRFDDPAVKGAHCYFSSANKGGFSANFNLQEDRSEYVLDCFANGALVVPANLPAKEVISQRSRSAMFKKLYIARLVDRDANRLIYVAYTRYLIDGSPKQAMSSIPFRPLRP